MLGRATTGEVRYGLGRRQTRVDIAAGNNTPIVRFANSPVAGTTIGNSGAFPIHRDQTDHQFVANLTKLVDAGLYTTFRTAWRHAFTVRVEAYNAFNSVQYGFPTADISNVNFGRLLSGATQYSPRTLQLGFQYKF